MMNRCLSLFVSLMLLAPFALVRAEEAEAPEEEKKSVWSTIDLQVYGYVKLDAAWDTAQAIPGNYVKWIELHPDNLTDPQFSMTANQTRLGLRIRGPKEPGQMVTQGRVEIDFYGGGEENKPRPFLRHAYVEILWPTSGWTFLAGLTSDVVSPLYPSTINYPVAWWAGNIGFRRPQIRGSKKFEASKNLDLDLAMAITRDIGSTASDFASVDSGTDAGVPGLQARLGFGMGSRDTGPIVLGISGHYSKEELEVTPDGQHEPFDSWSANLDLTAPFTEKVRLLAEAFTGINLASCLGGIGQGVNLDQMVEIGSTGGWLSMEFGPYGKATWRVGVSMDDPDEGDLEPLDRSRNSSIFGNGMFALSRHVSMGFELSYWETRYHEAETADSFRAQYAVYYRF